MPSENIAIEQKQARINKAVNRGMDPLQRKATELILDRAIKIAERPEEFYIIRKIIMNIIIFSTVVIFIVFYSVKFMIEYLDNFPAWLLLLKYSIIIPLFLLIFQNKIADKMSSQVKTR